MSCAAPDHLRAALANAWRGANGRADVELACGMVLLSPISSKSHFCVWLFPVAFVVNYLTRTKRDALGIMLFVIALALGLMSKGFLGREFANLMLTYGSVAWSTFFLLLATVRCLHVAAKALKSP